MVIHDDISVLELGELARILLQMGIGVANAFFLNDHAPEHPWNCPIRSEPTRMHVTKSQGNRGLFVTYTYDGRSRGLTQPRPRMSICSHDLFGDAQHMARTSRQEIS